VLLADHWLGCQQVAQPLLQRVYRGNLSFQTAACQRARSNYKLIAQTQSVPLRPERL
jgi:hypothetical protein